MKPKRKNIILMILCILVVIGAFYVWSQQATPARQFTVEVVDSNSDVGNKTDEWLKAYLNQYKNPMNMNNRIKDYTLEQMNDPFSSFLDDKEDIIVEYEIRVEAQKEPTTLFDIAPTHDNGMWTYDMVLTFSKRESVLKYIKSETQVKREKESLAAFKEIEKSDESDPLEDLYSVDDMNLKIRANSKESWIQTPIPSSGFSTQFQNHYTKDKRIEFEGQNIIVFHKNQGPAITSSQDGGVSWNTTSVIPDNDLGNQLRKFSVSFANLSFVGDEGYLVLGSHVAINSDIFTYHHTTDGGLNWTTGEIPMYSEHVIDASHIIAGKLFVTYEKDPSLYISQDGGETFDEVILPIDDIGLYTDIPKASGISWNQIFLQAEAPKLEDGILTMLVNQGEHGDFNRNVDAKFVSQDDGYTWQFDSFVEKPLPKWKTVN
ncbi:hypothetical protein G7061_09305 [Erysipelothrix sp. HDW6B]|uniref:WD40/YVTN/BNR-like repeat-containing protein n=1 Tax=Erysipelothrix sp. HDW6B TaxID=2714929 RepID=UPI00140E22AD|nr:hypothetical protein [Erysipelothrix sp. HDW6B]QIK86797.1 hypothetical protein G7061_09305 [Erysipelothrix sp. HDW6B]